MRAICRKQKKPERSDNLTGFETKNPLACGIFQRRVTSFFRKIKGFAEKNEVQQEGAK